MGIQKEERGMFRDHQQRFKKTEINKSDVLDVIATKIKHCADKNHLVVDKIDAVALKEVYNLILELD